MSSGLAARLRELSKEADRLQVAAVELAENISELCNPGSFGDWVLVDDAFDPLFPEDFAAVRALLVHHGLEDGFPPIPEELVRIAARALSGTPQEVVQKAQSAFRAGFLAHIALATSTPFLKNEQESEAEHCHWVVFYRHTPSINRRVTSLACKDVAITVEDCVWQGFDSLTELSIFCAGASVRVPRLEKWISPF